MTSPWLAWPRAGVAHHAHVADQVEAGRVGGDDDHAGPAVGRGVGVGDGHHDRERRAVGRRGEPLLAVDHVVVAVDGDRGGLQQRGVRARPSPARSSRSSCGSRRRPAGAGTAPSAPSVPCWCRISMLPASGAWVPNTVMPERAAARRPRLNRPWSTIDRPEPAELDRMVRRPQAHLLHLGLGGGHPGGQRLRGPVEHLALQRDHLPGHELVDHGQPDRHLVRNLEIHGAHHLRADPTTVMLRPPGSFDRRADRRTGRGCSGGPAPGHDSGPGQASPRSWARNPPPSDTIQPSATLPWRTRKKAADGRVTVRPVGATPRNSAVWVPWKV